MKQPLRNPFPMPKKSLFASRHLWVTASEWDSIRLLIAVRELRLRARMRVPQIAALLRLPEAEVRCLLRRPLETASHVSDSLTLRARMLRLKGVPPFAWPMLLKAIRHGSMLAKPSHSPRRRPPNTRAKAARRS